MEMNNENMFDDGDSFVFDRDSPDWKHNFFRFITLNIRNGGYSNLNMVLRGMYQMRVDFGVLTETKITNDMYTNNCCNYTVFASHAESKFKGGIALFYRTENIHSGGLKANGPMGLMSCRVFSFPVNDGGT
jgi:hypothetical protein